jgi:hypothetical protein
VADHRITCTEKTSASAHPRFGRIVAVGTGPEPDRALRRWLVPEVVTAMAHGDRFYTQGRATGRISWVESYWCSACTAHHLKAGPDVVPDNHLDALRPCR